VDTGIGERDVIDERALLALDAVLARSPLALVAFDRDYRLSYWSSRAVDAFGYLPDEVLGKRLEETQLIYRDDVADVMGLEARVHTEPVETLVVVNRVVHRDGAVRTYRWSTLARQRDFRFGAIVVGEDISATVEAQAALVESEQRFRALFEFNPETIVFLDVNGDIVDVNAAIAHFGAHVTRDAMLGKNFRDWLDPKDVPLHEAYMVRALAGETLSYHTRAISFSGRRMDLALTSAPLIRNGQVEGVFCIVRDETAAREAEGQIVRQERALLESEARLRSLFEHNPDPVLAIELDGTMVQCNEAAIRISGLTRDAIVGSSYLRFVPRETRPQISSAFSEAMRGKPATVTFGIVNAEGRALEIDSTIIPQYSQGEVVGIYAIFQDITDRRNAERRADMQRQRMRNLYFIATSSDRSETRMQSSLEMGTRAFGLGLGTVVSTGETPRVTDVYRAPSGCTLSDDDLIAMARSAARSSTAGTPVLSPRGVAARIDVGGEPYGALIFAGNTTYNFTETDADLLGLISTLVAGTIENELARTRLRTLAYYDTLTGLPNRAMLSEMLRDAIEVAQSRLTRVALLFLDLDGFKDVNDTLGHARGDQLLKLVSARLLGLVGGRASIARMGSDEFVVLLTDCSDVEEARSLAERIIASISEPFALDEYEQFISTSIGIAMYPEDGRDDQALIKNSDIAMSRAKDRGRNGYFFYNPTLEAPIHMRLSQEKLLRKALELDEFVVYYQPQLDLRNGRIVSVEALVRWNHPKSGLIEPGHFIPSAEISGLIVPLGDWVLRTAVRQLRKWHQELAPLRLAVNLSARQFHDRDLRKRILATLEEEGVDPSYLELEITESVAMADAAATAEILRALGASGVRIAVDDFGTGYSSLSYLRQFELDVLKVDGSFVKGIGRTSGDETIVNTIVGMAHSLDLEVIAEGVETLEQLAFLSAKGCDVVQGYVLAPALPGADLETFVRRRDAVSG
jgi:diguanylate cyclase (GGDEF)-like protein/PAS domain S-box-containing protein